MGKSPGGSKLTQWIGSLRGSRKAASAMTTPAEMLDRIYAGEWSDFGLYLRPPAGRAAQKKTIVSVNIEELLISAMAPLPVITLDEQFAVHSRLPEEAFLLLADRARLLCAAPMSDERYLRRLQSLKSCSAIQRCFFVMPDAETLGSVDWPAEWPKARQAWSTAGFDLSEYTSGGWLFRVDSAGKAVTFRPITNPNPEKVARAIESICGEM